MNGWMDGWVYFTRRNVILHIIVHKTQAVMTTRFACQKVTGMRPTTNLKVTQQLAVDRNTLLN
jgi:hypothetical protein